MSETGDVKTPRRASWWFWTMVLAPLLFLTLGVMLYCLNGNAEEGEVVLDYEVALRYTNEEGVYELRAYPGYGTALYKDGVEQKFLTSVVRKSNPLLVLPETEESFDITTLETDTPYSWEADLLTSAKYLNFLRDQGYTVVSEAVTSQFIEFYLSKDRNLVRVLVFSTVIFAGEVKEGVVLPTLQDYLEEVF